MFSLINDNNRGAPKLIIIHSYNILEEFEKKRYFYYNRINECILRLSLEIIYNRSNRDVILTIYNNF